MSTVQIIAYGTLMTGERNHRFCRNAVNIRSVTITGTLYDTGWGFPAFVPGETGTVKAELIEIPIADWPDMDRLEGYPRLYDRQLIPATLEDGGTVEAWVYVMNELPPQATVIESGDWNGWNVKLYWHSPEKSKREDRYRLTKLINESSERRV